MSDFTVYPGPTRKFLYIAKIFILMLCFITSFQIFLSDKAHSQWVWQNPIPTGNTFQTASYLDANNIIAAGQGGTSGISTDGGENWTVSAHGTSPTFSFYQTSYLAANLALAVAFDVNTGVSGIFKTTNGGVNWVQSFGALGQAFFGISFTDANTGTVVGASLMTGAGLIFRTTDGGNNWTEQTSGIFGILTNVHFSDANIGTAVGSGGIVLRTTNAGQNWVQQTSGITTDLTFVHFYNANTGMVVGGNNGTIIRTTNGGANWDSLSSGVSARMLGVYVRNGDTAFAVGDDCFLKTTDGGNTWISTPTTQTLFCVTFANITTGVIVGSDGTVLKTTDSGNNWIPTNSGFAIPMRSIFFSTQQIATSVGDNGTIMRTTNAGQNWFSQTSGTANQLLGVSFVGINTGFAVGANGTVIKTTDGGNNWFAQTSGLITQALNEVFFIDANTGFAVGAAGKIIKTTNGGDNWFEQTSGGTQVLADVYFVDANTGVVVGASGRVLKTTDGGTNWGVQSSGGTQALNGVCMADANTGMIVGASNRILRTTNGGTNWVVIVSGISSTYQAVTYLNTNTIFAVGNSGVIIKSTNAGLNWTKQPSGSGSNMFDVFFTDPYSGTVVGNSGTILRQQLVPLNSNYGNNNQIGDNLYYFANSVSPGAPSHPDFIWRDTTGSIDLYANGSNQAPGIFSGDNDNGRWDLLAQLGGGNIRFFGTDYTNIYIGTNGILGLNAFNPAASQPPAFGLNQSTITEAIFPLWMNMNIDYAGVSGRRISYKVTASELIVTYNRIPVYAPGSLTNDPDRYISFQVIVKFNNGSPTQNSQIFFSYNNDETGSVFVNEYNNATLRSHLVGIQKDNDPQQSFQYRYSNAITLGTEGPLFGSNLTLALGADPNVLPVELAAFTASVNNRNVQLDWTTVNELNNSGFEIEKTLSNNQSWQKIGFVNGNGTVNEMKSFSYTDNNVSSGVYNYRLKQIDYNGNFEYYNLSNEVIVGVPAKFDLSQNYPNPFNPVTKINFDIPVDGKVTLKIYDVMGREVAILVNEVRQAGYHTVSFNAVNIASGIYFYKIIAGTEQQFTMTKKMMVIK